jgi:hypothetical protein
MIFPSGGFMTRIPGKNSDIPEPALIKMDRSSGLNLLKNPSKKLIE